MHARGCWNAIAIVTHWHASESGSWPCWMDACACAGREIIGEILVRLLPGSVDVQVQGQPQATATPSHCMHACTPLQVPSGTGVPPFAEQSPLCAPPADAWSSACKTRPATSWLPARTQSHTHEGPARQQPASYCLYAAKSTGRYEPAGRPRLGCGTMQQAQEPKPQLTHTACRDALCRCTWYHRRSAFFYYYSPSVPYESRQDKTALSDCSLVRGPRAVIKCKNTGVLRIQ